MDAQCKHHYKLQKLNPSYLKCIYKRSLRLQASVISHLVCVVQMPAVQLCLLQSKAAPTLLDSTTTNYLRFRLFVDSFETS